MPGTRNLGGRPRGDDSAATGVAVRPRPARDPGAVHLFEIGPDRLLRCEDDLRLLLGLVAGAQPLRDAWLARLHPDDRERVGGAIDRLLRDGGSAELDARVQRPDGSLRRLRGRLQEAPGRRGTLIGAVTDVTGLAAEGDGQRDGQRAIEQSEGRLRAALESTTDSVFLLSADWRFTFLNRQAIAQIAGGRELVGQVVWDAFPEAVGGTLWQAYRRCMAERVPVEAEQFYAPLGRLFMARAFPAEDGGIAVFFRDVTEARRAAARLAEAEGLLRALGEASPDLLYAKDRQGRLLYANPATLGVIGRPAEAAIGRNEAEWHPDPARAAAIMAIDQRIMASGGTETVEEPFPDARSAEIRIFQSTKTPLRDPATGEVIGLVGVSRDVTAAHRAAERDAYLAAIVTSSADAMISIDATSRRIRSWNPAAERLFGYTEAEALGAPAGLLVPPDRPEGDPTGLFLRTVRGEAVEEHETVRLAKDGRRVPVAVTAARILGPDGGVIGVSAMFRDITARKQAEAVLARGKAELERLVEARTRDLQETQARLAHAQRMEALGQLAGGIAHDFNNVLQATRSGAALIERRAGDPEVVRHLARMVAEAAERGTAITQRLLAFSRRGELRAEPLDPAGLLASMREILAHTLGAGVEVRTRVAAGLPPLLADKGQLETVLVNLATNARDAMDGAGTLTLAARTERRAEADSPGHPVGLQPGHYIRMAVTDTGCGMTPATLARASEPFFTTKGPGKGTGLGLAMARGFAEQSGGGLHIESAPGRGTTVTLWLPVAEGDARPAVGGGEAAMPAGGERRRILLVDDEELVREMLARDLVDRGYEVIQAGAPAAALALLEAGEPVDALVSDLSMPRMNGTALIREAKRRRPGLPCILLTGYAGDLAEPTAAEAASGSFALLRKPVGGDRLAEQVAALLRAAAAG
ncbi:hybrid sensor histidine kinase/response regulator [Roseicella aquatilis]|uniref:histidine kinase n=1 Tax=Roseicella aquatilis TaxID=2527868 RepID=A0A4V2WM29_9PROT|nr:PAS domain-containing protein [Roseicella aquatilis]TCZ66002.1 PAS domain S-box protein [Roseicella aquatilis]